MTKIATPEQVRKHWIDQCPVCGGQVVAACKCPRNERVCIAGHEWRRLDDGSYVLTNGHADLPPVKLGEAAREYDVITPWPTKPVPNLDREENGNP